MNERVTRRSRETRSSDTRFRSSHSPPYLATAYAFLHGVEVPDTIIASADALEQDKRIADVLGAEITKHWVESRRWEWMMFHTTGGDPEAASVTDWELDRYFELV